MHTPVRMMSMGYKDLRGWLCKILLNAEKMGDCFVFDTRGEDVSLLCRYLPPDPIIVQYPL